MTKPCIARRKLRVAAGRPRRDKHRCVTRTAAQSRASWYKGPSRSRRCRFSRGPGGTMALRTILLTGLRILATCLLFAVCFTVGGVLSGLDKIAQQSIASQPVPLANQQVPPMPDNFLRSFLIFTFCVGGILSYLILRSRWHGWMLVGAIFVGMYGISTVAIQLDSVAFLSNKLPPGIIRAIFVQGAIAAALFAPLAVLVLGKWRVASPPAPRFPAAPLKVAWILPRLAILVAAFVFLYMFFGYYVAWRNPELQRFYGGAELATFWA